jgi:hypothetical protein
MTFVGQGTVQRQGITFYQYGDYVLRQDEQTICAMKNGAANIEPWVGRFVYIKGCEVPGYPLEGGPPFVEVNYIGEDRAARDAYPDCDDQVAPPTAFQVFIQRANEALNRLLSRGVA